MQGYIKLNRSLQNWRYYKKPNYLALWIHILLEANHQDGKWEDVVIKRGQMVTSIERLSNDTGISVQTVRTILSKLKSEELTIKSTNKYSVITVLKYDEYQGSNSDTNKQTNNQLTNDQQATNNQLTTNKNNKNNKNVKKYIYKGSERLISAYEDFEEMRRKIKKPLTERAKEMLVDKLNSLSDDEQTQIKILEQSIVNCWQGVYPLKKEDKVSEYNSSLNRSISAEDEKEILQMMGKA